MEIVERMGCGELECVGKLEIGSPKPVGFLCGSIPVLTLTDKSFRSLIPSTSRQHQTVCVAPRYRILPMETDLNTPPLFPNLPDRAPLPLAHHGHGDVATLASNLARKSESLAVSGVADHGDEVDLIAPADILKQIFKIPYSKARLSIAVQRIGQTLILNPGPDVEEGEKFRRRHSSQTKSADQSLFLNFAMHSVRVEACDCPPTHQVPAQENPNSSVLPGVNTPQFMGKRDDVVQRDKTNSSGYGHFKHDELFWGKKNHKRCKGRDPVKKVSQVGEKPRSTMKESEKHKRAGDDGFLRVLFWQFHNFRMLLGSDLMLFSNEKYVAVSLHLWDVSTEITPLTWLEAWLDNIMASVPELAICYHRNGVVQGYELIKTDDIFLLKGIAEDGTPAFHPYVVQQNGLSVLRFIQENCKQEPGAYWLYKSAGEDVIQLFDLSVISKNRSSNDCDGGCSSSMPALVHNGRSDSLHSLGTLLYRIAHRLSLSMAPDKRAKCATFIKKCLEFLDEPDHLVVRALAHEQFARLILNHEENLELTSEAFPVECEVTFSNAEEEDSYFLSNASDMDRDGFSSLAIENASPYEVGESSEGLMKDFSIKTTLEANTSSPGVVIESGIAVFDSSREAVPEPCDDESCTVRELSPTTAHVVQTVADPISSKLAAVHHVSQAIKSLRWMRQLQSTESEMKEHDSESPDMPLPSENLSVCACGDPDCIEVCDIMEWLPTSKLDHKLWKLVLLLGESYLALGQAYKVDGQLHQALKVVDLACSVYGSMPQHLKDSRFISSMIGCSSSKARSYDGNANHVISGSNNRLPSEDFSLVYLFWAKAWTLVGDVFVENYMVKGNEISKEDEEKKPSAKEVKVSSEVVKEVSRLKKRLGKYMQNCSSCSLVNCSCQNDRANSGSSASSRSGGDTRSTPFGRKQNKKASAKSKTYSILDDREDANRYHNDNDADEDVMKSSEASYSEKGDGILQKHDIREAPKDGGIFKYLRGPMAGDIEYLLSVAFICYKEARNALGGRPAGAEELQSIVKKLGWVCNELGRYRLGRKELSMAEVAFADAIKAFREVSDHANIILINCNLGHGRRALAEAMVSRIDDLKLHGIYRNLYNQALETAKLEYRESLRYYGAAKLELNTMGEETGSLSSSLRTEVYTQFAHTYLRLGMLLAREDITTEVYGNGVGDVEITSYKNPCGRKSRKEIQKHEISANIAIREALSLYESLGDLRKQEVAFAHFQLACYQRDCCLKFMESVDTKTGSSKGESNALHRTKQYASLAERNWQKAAEFYGPKMHHTMYLKILMERSTLLSNLSNALHSNLMLESAVTHLLEGRNLGETAFDSLKVEFPELHSKYWGELQMLLKKMLVAAMSSTSIPADAGKLRDLYGKSLKSSNFSQLISLYSLWAS